MYDDDDMDELLRWLVETLAAARGLTPQQYLRRLFFRALEHDPAWTILPSAGTDRHGARGLGCPPVHPSALDRIR